MQILSVNFRLSFFLGLSTQDQNSVVVLFGLIEMIQRFEKLFLKRVYIFGSKNQRSIFYD